MMRIRVLTIGILSVAVCVAAVDREPATRTAGPATPVQVGGCDQTAESNAKIEAMFSNSGQDRSVEVRRMPVDESTIDELIRAGKTVDLDLQKGERLFRHITDYLPEGWGKARTDIEPIDSLGNPIVNHVPGLPGWAQHNVDSLRADIARWRDLLPTLDQSARIEGEGVLGNYIGQALVRGIAIADLVDLSDRKVVTAAAAQAAIEQVHFYENVKVMRSGDGSYTYEPSQYDDSIIEFIESHGRTLDEVLAIGATAKADPKATPSGCYSRQTFARGMTTLTGATVIWQQTGDDDASADVPTGFRFYFYACDDPDANWNVRVSTNGYISFYQQGGGALDGTDYSNDPITSTIDPDGYAAPSWDDYYVHPTQGNTDKVSYLTEGAIGERVFTVEWFSMSHLGGDASDWHFFQVKLFEATGNVELHTSNDWSQDSVDSSTIGIEDFDGLDGDCGPNCGNTNVNADITDNYRFVPNRPANDGSHNYMCVGSDTQLTADNFGATGADVSSCGSNDFKDVWVFYHAPMSGNVTFDTCAGTTIDTTLSVFDSSGITEFACNDDGCGLQSSVTAALTGGQDYLVRVAGYNGSEGDYTLTATPSHGAPSGDTCGAAWAISGGFSGFTDNNSGCVDETSCGYRDTIDEWFAWTAPLPGVATATTVSPSTNFDTTLAVFDSCGGSQLACNDDAGGLQSTIEWPVVQGTTYYIRVAGFAFDYGDYDLTVTTASTLIFSDGFESGNTTAWSNTVP